MSLIERVIAWYVDNITYLTVGLLMTIESSFIPFPSEIVIPPAAWKAAAGELNVVLVVVSGVAGSILGALINYVLAVLLGRPVVHAISRTRLANALLIDERSVTRAEAFFVKHGASATLVGRLVPAIRQLISIPAGLARMPLVPFVLYTTLGSAVWSTTLAALGYFLYTQRQALERYYDALKIAGVVLGVLFVAYLVYRGIRARPGGRAPDGGQRPGADASGDPPAGTPPP